jgi:hypothetical protein
MTRTGPRVSMEYGFRKVNVEKGVEMASWER